MPIRTRNKEILFAVVMVVISASMVYGTYDYPSESVQFPRFLMVLQCVFSAMLLVRALRLPGGAAVQSGGASAQQSQDSRRIWIPIQVFVGVSAYILAIEYIGYFVSTAFFLCGSMAFFGRNKAASMLGVTAACLLVIYVLFSVLIGVRLPAGLLI
ncbi:MAG: tripartite tricarboxylate transporter TctB family protein [Castellaniella sp.]|uniref:tripartite tricarboxylate transporter TctB family protein n=1 Tax=Castellaniella sp. TaxID=1955812 RepID=UPI003C77F05A